MSVMSMESMAEHGGETLRVPEYLLSNLRC